MTTIMSGDSGHFLKAVLSRTVEASIQELAVVGKTNVLITPPQRYKFQHQNHTLGSVHDSNQSSTVRIFVGHS